MPKAAAVISTVTETLLAFLLSKAKQNQYIARARKMVGSKNGCAATASQPYVDLAVIEHAYAATEDWPAKKIEGLVSALKRTRRFKVGASIRDVKEGCLIVCQDLADKPMSDHVWHVLKVLGDGWYLCFDNNGVYKRRLDGDDGRTPMRGWMLLVK